MKKQFLLSYFVAFGLSLLCASAAQAAAVKSDAPATAMLERLNHTLNSAQAVEFSATVAVAPKPGEKPATYALSGTLQKPNMMDVKIRQLSGPADLHMPVEYVCDGKTYTVYSAGLGQYSRAPAPPKGFEPEMPDTNYFIYDVTGASGEGLLNTAGLFFPADFNAADDKLPKGTTRTIVVSTSSAFVNGIACEDIAQRVTGAHSTYIYHTVINPAGGTLVRSSIDRVKSGKIKTIWTATFTKLTTTQMRLASTYFHKPPPVTASLYIAPAAPGTVAPQFTVAKPSGAKTSLSNYLGRVVVLDFWATWCGPCKVTLPRTNKLAAKYQPKGVVFMPVCTWDNKSNFTRWLPAHRTWSLNWYFDPAAESEEKSIANSQFAVSGIPTLYVIDKQGVIIYRGYGDTSAGEKPLIKAIDQAMSM